MVKKNYARELDILLQSIGKWNFRPKLLLHSCCAPCSSYVIEYLTNFFDITIFYYNPNIAPYEEYLKRKDEQIALIKKMEKRNNLNIVYCDYDNDIYEKKIKGLENEPEKGNRCKVCFRLRLEKTAITAKRDGFDFFGTTLTVSPYKNAQLINEIGLELAKEYDVNYLVSDFKKNNGYKRSIELSKKYNLYRQDYCGCKYSVRKKDRGEE
ncbi:MAG: epoxyqueuosine reductase QueH [Bacilli bacterium]|nr:epoxyqueuosine reductase QueH [Bacilli bacterium]